MATTYEVLVEGDGKVVSAGDTVTVHATGIVKETGKKFWCRCTARFRLFYFSPRLYFNRSSEGDIRCKRAGLPRTLASLRSLTRQV
jgi:hypothetical protein